MLCAMRRSLYYAFLMLGPGVLGCKTQETKECHRQMTEAQALVNQLDQKSRESVQQSLDAIERARQTCAQAGRDDESTQLEQAKERLSAHLALLKRRALEQEDRKLSPKELEKLVKRGDPSCPKGQAYRHRASGKEIRCTGPLVINMTFAQARENFEARGFKRLKSDSASTLSFEFGSERYEFRFAKENDTAPARCVVVHPAPGVSWQEAVSRMTGISPQRLKKDGTVKTARGPRKLEVAGKENAPIIQIGECS